MMKLKNIKNRLVKTVKNQSGQGMVEYILLLVAVIAIAAVFKGKITSLVESKMGDVSGQISSFGSGGN